MPEIRVRIIYEIDYSPDLSFLGDYSDTPGPRHQTVVRNPRCRGPRYFISTRASVQAEAHEDHKRFRTHGLDWYMIGIRAVATVSYGRSTCTFTSPGIWGVENDAPAAWLQELAKDECSMLQLDMIAAGLPEAQVREAFENAEQP